MWLRIWFGDGHSELTIACDDASLDGRLKTRVADPNHAILNFGF